MFGEYNTHFVFQTVLYDLHFDFEKMYVCQIDKHTDDQKVMELCITKGHLLTTRDAIGGIFTGDIQKAYRDWLFENQVLGENNG